MSRFQNSGPLFSAFLVAVLSTFFSQDGFAQSEKPTHLTYVRRNDSREGDYKIVTVPATNARQARLDAQTYHIGWTALEARMGQSRVMYNVLLKKRAPYVPGTPPVSRPIPKERRR